MMGESTEYEFGHFRLNRLSRRLLHREQPVLLTNKSFELLVLLVQKAGEVLSKERLMAALWPNTFVADGNLTQNVSTLRKVLAVDSSMESYIETVPRLGYRFTGSVREVQPREDEQSGNSRSIVVLPFLNLSSDADNEYFSDGLTEEITNALVAIPGLKVVARTTSFQFKGQNLDVRVIGSKVGADAVLEGSVRRQGDKLRIMAQLNSGRDGYHYWSRSWDRELKDIFEVQREIAEGVARELGPNLVTNEPVSAPTSVPEAYNFYLRGLFLANRLLVPEAVKAFEQAVEKDPHFAAANAALAYQHSLLGYESAVRPQAAYAAASHYAARALEQSPRLPAALFAKGWIATFYDWDWVAAERYLKQAIVGNQQSSGAHHAYAHYLVALGRFDEGLVQSQKMLTEESYSPTLNGHLAWHHIYSGRPDLAIPQAHHALSIDPMLTANLRYLRWACEAIGDYSKAIQAAERHHSPDFVSQLREAFRTSGEAGYWRMWLEDLLHQRKRTYGSPYEIATVAAQLGRTDEAVDWLRCAFDERDSWIVYLKIDPKLKHIQHENGVRDLIRQLRLN
jgi:adenylate cyclase